MSVAKYWAHMKGSQKDALVHVALQPLMHECNRSVTRNHLNLDEWYCDGCGAFGKGVGTHQAKVRHDAQFSQSEIWALSLLKYLPDVCIYHSQEMQSFTITCKTFGTHIKDGVLYTMPDMSLPNVICYVFLRFRNVLDRNGRLVEEVKV